MSTNNPEASPTPADESERLSFKENLEVQRKALTEELADRLIQFRDETGVTDLYAAETLAKRALLEARELALEKEKDKSSKSE